MTNLHKDSVTLRLRVRSKPAEAKFLPSGVRVSDAMPIGCPSGSFLQLGGLRGPQVDFMAHEVHQSEGDGNTDAASFLAWAAGPPDELCGPTPDRRPLHALLHTEMSASLDAHSQQRQFLRAQRRIHSIDPIHLAFHRPRRKDNLDRIIPMIPRPQAAPTPVLRSRN